MLSPLQKKAPVPIDFQSPQASFYCSGSDGCSKESTAVCDCCKSHLCVDCLGEHKLKLREKLYDFDDKIKQMQESFENLYSDDMIYDEIKSCEQQLGEWYKTILQQLDQIIYETKENIHQTGQASENKLHDWRRINSSKFNEIRVKLMNFNNENVNINYVKTIEEDISRLEMTTPKYKMKYNVQLKEIDLPKKGFQCEPIYTQTNSKITKEETKNNPVSTKLKKAKSFVINLTRQKEPTPAVIPRNRKPSCRNVHAFAPVIIRKPLVNIKDERVAIKDGIPGRTLQSTTKIAQKQLGPKSIIKINNTNENN